ncbi:hypothetical protein RRG08_001164 [Elysia crispata]|uniref:Uncharacterized protein n=1 Tax=Elysia crispata TaxID=231223 RepID=A0AAE1A4N3_9GAST|nr:hypothetical protein RRG08_001164 [Elysia crispata]
MIESELIKTLRYDTAAAVSGETPAQAVSLWSSERYGVWLQLSQSVYGAQKDTECGSSSVSQFMELRKIRSVAPAQSVSLWSSESLKIRSVAPAQAVSYGAQKDTECGSSSVSQFMELRKIRSVAPAQSVSLWSSERYGVWLQLSQSVYGAQKDTECGSSSVSQFMELRKIRSVAPAQSVSYGARITERKQDLTPGNLRGDGKAGSFFYLIDYTDRMGFLTSRSGLNGRVLSS